MNLVVRVTQCKAMLGLIVNKYHEGMVKRTLEREASSACDFSGQREFD